MVLVPLTQDTRVFVDFLTQVIGLRVGPQRPGTASDFWCIKNKLQTKLSNYLYYIYMAVSENVVYP